MIEDTSATSISSPVSFRSSRSALRSSTNARLAFADSRILPGSGSPSRGIGGAARGGPGGSAFAAAGTLATRFGRAFRWLLSICSSIHLRASGTLMRPSSVVGIPICTIWVMRARDTFRRAANCDFRIGSIVKPAVKSLYR